MNLYLTEQGCAVRKTGQRLIVEKEGQELLEIECFKLRTIFLFGRIHITTPALIQLLDYNIALAFLTLGGRLKGKLTPPMSKNVVLRMAQYEKSRDTANALLLARHVVAGKIENGRRFLDRHHRNRPDAGFARLTKQLQEDLEKVPEADTHASLLGVEGDSARTYFQGIALACNGHMKFTGRRRRPPPDPVNALLSFGYTLVAAEITSLLDAMGFDPYIGLFHQLRYGRTSLALDLLEEFRVDAVDRLVLNLVNRKILGHRHFQDRTAEGEGCRLSPEGRKIFFRAYEEHLLRPIPCSVPMRKSSLREAFQYQAHRLAKTLVDNAPYTSFKRM